MTIFGIVNPEGTKDNPLLKDLYIVTPSGGKAKIEEGDFFVNPSGTKDVVIREPQLSLGIRPLNTNMDFIWSYNHTTISNPIIVIMGSSTSISYNLPTEDSIQYKIQQYANANWGGATIHNIGVGGTWSNQWRPTSEGGTVGMNIDSALAYKPNLILLMGPTNDAQEGTKENWLANLHTIVNRAITNGARIILMSPHPRSPYNSDQQQMLSDSAKLQIADFPYIMYNTFDSDIRLKPPATSNLAEGNPIYFQSDTFHLNALGTTYVTDNFIIPTIEREFRANTAYKKFVIEKSTTGPSSGFTTFDEVTDQQVIKKTYMKSLGYYRVTAQLEDNSFLPYSNVVQVTNEAPIANAGPNQTLDSGTTSTTLTSLSTDPDGSIVSYLWELISGTGAIITSPNSSSTSITSLVNDATYTFQLTVVDNNGASSTDTVVVSVAAAIEFVISQWNCTGTAQNIPGWVDIIGNPSTDIVSAVSNGLTLSTIGTQAAGGNWNGLGGSSQTANGSDGLTPTNTTYVFNAAVTTTAFFNYGTNYTAGKMNLRIAGFTPGEIVPEIHLLGSRDSVLGGGIATSVRYMDCYCKDANGITVIENYDVKDNQTNLCSFYNRVADASGYIELGVWRPDPAHNDYQIGYANAIQVKRTA